MSEHVCQSGIAVTLGTEIPAVLYVQKVVTMIRKKCNPASYFALALLQDAAMNAAQSPLPIGTPRLM